MSESKHTQGPWRARELGSFGVVNVATDNRPVAMTATQLDRDEDEANARLIAAAPDLLAACKEALDFCEAVLAGYHIQEMYNNLELAIAKAEGVPDDELQRRRAAIAKAKGEQQCL